MLAIFEQLGIPSGKVNTPYPQMQGVFFLVPLTILDEHRLHNSGEVRNVFQFQYGFPCFCLAKGQ